MSAIDWTVFDKYSENTNECRCGAVFRSHTKAVMIPEPHLISRKSCPKCGRHDDLCRSSSDPEMYTIN